MFLWVSVILSGGAREHRDNVSVLLILLNKIIWVGEVLREGGSSEEGNENSLVMHVVKLGLRNCWKEF